MAKKLDPIISEFDTQEEADAYDKWFREKVERALSEPGATYTHDEVMAEMDAIIKEAGARRKAEPAENAPAPGKLDPIVSEFETQEQADSYDAWYRQQVQAGIDDPRPRIPHDQVMAEMRAIIDAAMAKQKRHA